jgi:hypothetical protein
MRRSFANREEGFVFMLDDADRRADLTPGSPRLERAAHVGRVAAPREASEVRLERRPGRPGLAEP